MTENNNDIRHTEDDFSKLEDENASLQSKIAALEKSASEDIATNRNEPEAPNPTSEQIKAKIAAIEDKFEDYDETKSAVDEMKEKTDKWDDLQSTIEDIKSEQEKFASQLQAQEDSEKVEETEQVEEMANKIAENDITSGKIKFNDKENHINTLKQQSATQLQALLGYSLHAAQIVGKQASMRPKYSMPTEDIKSVQDSLASRRAKLYTGGRA